MKNGNLYDRKNDLKINGYNVIINMKPIHKITNIGDLLEDMDRHYWSRPMYELYNGCSSLLLYIYNLIR